VVENSLWKGLWTGSKTDNRMNEWKETAIVFGTVHSNSTAVVLMQKRFSSWLGTFCEHYHKLCVCYYESSLTLRVCQQFFYVRFPSNTDRLSPIFHLDCTGWRRFMFLMLVRRPVQLKRSLNDLRDCISSVIDPDTWLMAWQWCRFLLASSRR